MIHRAITYSYNNHVILNDEIQYIRNIALQNGYNREFVNNIYNGYLKKTYINRNTTLIPINDSKKLANKKYISYNFINKNTNKIINIYDKDQYTIAYKPINNIVKHLKYTGSSPINKYHQSGIYKIKCTNCDAIYIGKTDRSFNTRFLEHLRAFKNKKKSFSNVAEHLISNKHVITDIENNLEILEICNNKNKLEHLEKYYIYKYKNFNLINHQVNFEQDDLFMLVHLFDK